MNTKPLVIYADDDVDDIMLIKEAFEQHTPHIDLFTVEDGTDVIEYLNNQDNHDRLPCLIILDVNMPRLNGRSALQHIRLLEFCDNIPVILFTTSTQQTDIEFAKQYNAGYIPKPLQYTEVSKIVETFVSHCSDEIKAAIKTMVQN